MPERLFTGLYFDYAQHFREWFEEFSKQRIALNTDLITPTKEESGDAALDFVLDTAFYNVKRHGTMEQLVISDHGSPMYMDNIRGIAKFLDALKKREEKEGIKIADRIVFAGCNIFDMEQARTYDLPEGTVDRAITWLRNYAMQRHVELVGTTTTLSVNPAGMHFGRWVVFTPEGVIKRDRLDKQGPVNAINRVVNPDLNDSWVKKADSKQTTRIDAGLEDTWVARYVAKHPEAGLKIDAGRTAAH